MLNRLSKLSERLSTGIGMIGSLRGTTQSLLAWMENRLALLVVDIEAEKIRFISLLVTTISALFFLGFGLLFSIATLALVFWETHRVLIFAGVAIIFLFIGFILLISLNSQRKRPSALFSASIDELKKDQQVFTKETEND